MRDRHVVGLGRAAGPHEVVRRAAQPAGEPLPRFLQGAIGAIADAVRTGGVSDKTFGRVQPGEAGGGGEGMGRVVIEVTHGGTFCMNAREGQSGLAGEV